MAGWIRLGADAEMLAVAIAYAVQTKAVLPEAPQPPLVQEVPANERTA